jgi:primary-amine oxidase
MRTIAVLAAAFLGLGAGCRGGASKEGDAAKTRAMKEVAAHPLDPLTWSEIETAMEVLRAGGKFAEGMFVPTLVLREPSKETVRAFRAGAPLQREAFAIVLDRKGNRTSEAIVDVGKKAIVSWKEVPGVQPNVLEEEFESVPEIVRADPAWQAAIAKRGITDTQNVLVDTWAAGVLPAKGAAPGARLCRAISFYRGQNKNGYGRPIEGVVAVVDVNQGKVVEVVDTGVRPVARSAQDFDAKSLGRPRAGLKPLSVEQSQGPSFQIAGNRVRWQNWQFRFALHPREGLVLYTVGYEEGGKVRPILHRASISEMVVPYGDPDVNWVWKSAFDEGEYGLGRLANELEPGRDAPDNAVFADAVMATETGEPDLWRNAVAFFERDGGILWKHYDDFTERAYTRRARELVMLYTVTVGNYDYFIHWIFHLEGTIEVRAQASGILLAKGVPQATCQSCAAAAEGKPAEGDEKTGTLVAERIVAPNHQHFFNFRLDFDVDGEANSVSELNVSSIPEAQGNPHLNGFMMEKTLLATEKAAQRDMNLATQRHWKVFNPGAKNSIGHSPGYMIAPGENSIPYSQPASATRKRAGFMSHHLWVTPYKAGEMNASGTYPNQNPQDEGLPKWTADDEPIVNRDVVLWYTVGLTHIPRPEEWPIMPTGGVSFKLVPFAFFTANPVLDVPDPGDGEDR